MQQLGPHKYVNFTSKLKPPFERNKHPRVIIKAGLKYLFDNSGDSPRVPRAPKPRGPIQASGAVGSPLASRTMWLTSFVCISSLVGISKVVSIDV